jgi:membrane protein
VRKLISIYAQALRQFLRHDGPVSSGHLAFLTLLGLFPFLIFIISLAALAGQTRAGIETIYFFLTKLPADVQIVLIKPVNGLLHDISKRILLTSIIGAIWISSSTVNAARAAIRRAYNLHDRPAFLRQRLESIGLIILSGIAVVAGMMILVLGPVAMKALNHIIPISHAWLIFSDYVSVFLGLLFMFPALYGAYFVLGPKGHRRRTPHFPGVLTAIILWGCVGAAFSSYLKYFGQYSNTYGSLAGPIIALLFFYVMNAAFLFGAEVNAALLKGPEKAQKIEPSEKDT